MSPLVDSELELVLRLVPTNIMFTNISGDKATQAGGLENELVLGS
jgi:hypothetical protein